MGSRAKFQILIGRLAVAGFALCVSSPAIADCDREHVHLSGPWGSAQFSVEIADSPQERAIGLMNRENLARFSGMLFVFEDDHIAQFWMKNTLIPLDIMYFDRDGQLINIWEQAQPGELVGEPSARLARYVLEINGGLSATLGIAPPTQMFHPEIANLKKTGNCS